jgi:hypothetical protein
MDHILNPQEPLALGTFNLVGPTNAYVTIQDALRIYRDGRFELLKSEDEAAKALVEAAQQLINNLEREAYPGELEKLRRLQKTVKHLLPL